MSRSSSLVGKIPVSQNLTGCFVLDRDRTVDLRSEPGCPVVSVVIACWNSSVYLEDCVASVLAQTLSDIEVIIVDDASTDESPVIIKQLCEADSRLFSLRCTERLGPASARNLALDICRGRWIAIVDSDDLLHPERLAKLVEVADAGQADLVADNQILFNNDVGNPASRLLVGDLARKVTDVSCSEYVRSNDMGAGRVALGYLKPLMRRSFLDLYSLRYNPELIVAEDYDLVFRMMLAGASLRIVPYLTYFYRRHPSSISFRLSRDAIARMLIADAQSCNGRQHLVTDEIEKALSARRRNIRHLLQFSDLIQAMKNGCWGEVGAVISNRPLIACGLFNVMRDRVRRALVRPRSRGPHGKVASILSRQRVTGATNGSSVYLLGICEALARDGWFVDLVCPSPAMFGRWPVLRLQHEMSVFRSIHVRGAVRVGPFVVAINPAIAGRAALAVTDRLLRKVGLSLGLIVKKAPHAIAVPCADADKLFIATYAQSSSLLVADYAFLSEVIPFAMTPRARSAIIMHDLFSAQKTQDRPVVVDRCTEMGLLASADLVVAIQREEAEIVASHIGGERVIVVPMAFDTVGDAQAGNGSMVFFVGSNTLPNVDGLEWLIADVWPSVVQSIPSARLVVAGSVCQAIRTQRRDIRLVGRVDSLTELYREAAVIVSPLRSGSGLKVKLVEALANGKALVGTSVTFQGVEHLAGSAAICADDAQSFSEAVIACLRDEKRRLHLGRVALEVAKREFSPNESIAEFLRFARDGRAPVLIDSIGIKSGSVSHLNVEAV